MGEKQPGEGDGPSASPRLPRVLVVGDRADALAELGKLLSAVPADGVPTATCDAARYAAKTLGRFEVVIADAEMADGDAVELVAELKRLHGCATLVVSAHDRPAPAGGDGDALPAGIDLWIARPLRLAALRKAIRALLKR
jgi:DNA-binding response OmpR family regulator